MHAQAVASLEDRGSAPTGDEERAPAVAYLEDRHSAPKGEEERVPTVASPFD